MNTTPEPLVFVESNLTGTGMEAIRLAAELGFDVVFATSDLTRYTHDPDAAETLETLVSRVLECDTLDPASVVAAIEESGIRPRAVTTVGEYYVPTACTVASKLGLPGLDPDAAATARNKLATREALRRAGVPSPAFRFVGNVAEVPDVVAEVGLPCVVKPTDESASVGVLLCRTLAEVEAAIAEMVTRSTNSRGQEHTPGGLVEECLFGHEVSVETFTFAGTTHVLGVTDKLLGPTPYFLETGHTFPSSMPDEVTRSAAEAAVTALDAVGFDFGPAHVEVKLTPRAPVVIEINPRTGGDFIPLLVEQAVGVNLLRENLVACSGGTPSLAPSRRRAAAIRFLTGRDGTVASVVGADLAERFPAVLKVHVKVAPGHTTHWPRNSHDRLGSVIAVADTPAVAAAEADAAVAQVALTYTSKEKP